MRGFFTQAVAVLYDRAPTLSAISDALATPILRRIDESDMWQLSGPSVIVDYRRAVNGLVAVDVVDRAWPDEMGSPDVDPNTFGAWSMGHFGPFAYPGNLGRAVEQAWTWPGGAAQAIAKHGAFVRLRVSYAFGSKDEDKLIPESWDPLSELRIITRYASRLTALPGAIAFFDPNGEVLVPARELAPHLASADKHGHPPIDTWTNVRMMSLRQVAPGWTMMDTVGMAQLDRPDLEVVFKRDPISPDDVARFLRNVSLYVLTNGDVIKDGHTVDGPGGKWRATMHEEGLSGPPRATIRFVPDGVDVPEALLQTPPS